MPLRSHGDHDTNLNPMNLTPMIDVLFNLILFFMVGTEFYDYERQLDVRVPDVAQSAPLSSPPEAIVVNISADGAIKVENQEIDAPGLVALLQDARKRYAEQAVLIRGDQRVVYQRVADVLSACEVADVRHVSLATRVEPVAPRR